VGKFCRAGQSTDDYIVRCMRIACWVTKATDRHSEYVIMPFHDNKRYANHTPSIDLYLYTVL